MDLHGELRLVLQFEEADIADSQTIAMDEFRPTSTQKPPVAPLKHHFGLPYLPHALEHHGLPSSWKMDSSSISRTQFLVRYRQRIRNPLKGSHLED